MAARRYELIAHLCTLGLERGRDFVLRSASSYGNVSPPKSNYSKDACFEPESWPSHLAWNWTPAVELISSGMRDQHQTSHGNFNLLLTLKLPVDFQDGFKNSDRVHQPTKHFKTIVTKWFAIWCHKTKYGLNCPLNWKLILTISFLLILIGHDDRRRPSSILSCHKRSGLVYQFGSTAAAAENFAAASSSLFYELIATSFDGIF